MKNKALLLCHFLNEFTGSAVVVHEIAIGLKRRGLEVDVGGVVVSGHLLESFRASGINAFAVSERISAVSYKLVWVQHLTFGWVDYFADSEVSERPTVYFAHLSPFEPLEQVTYPLEAKIASKVFVNSEETRMVISQSLPAKKLINFRNAAPSEFMLNRRVREECRRILFVSNHSVPELDEAVSLLRTEGFEVAAIGVHTGNYRFVTPMDIGWADVVVSIGKTVPYCLVGEAPVFIYGPNGGSGYLRRSNFAENAKHNFSGRPKQLRKSAATIVSQIKRGFASAVREIHLLRRRHADDYDLERVIDIIYGVAKYEPATASPVDAEVHECYYRSCRIIAGYAARY